MGGAGGAGTGGQSWDPRFEAFAQALQDDLAASSAYGVSAAVMEQGEVTFAVAFGSKDPEGQEPLLPTTLMQIGSTTKQMTAVALLQRVQAGEVSLGDTLAEALPDLSFDLDPSWSDQIELRHLLSHQGGFYDYTPWGTSSDDADLAAHAYGPFAATEFLMNPPGLFWNYANPNFTLAGLVTEELDSRAWPDLMVEDVFQPLGMTRSYLRKSEVEADGDYALSYGFGVDDLEAPELGLVAMEDMPDPAFTRPAGLAWTTPTQQMAWADFVMHGDEAVLSAALREQLTEEQIDTLYLVGNMHYGFGMFVWRGYLTGDGTWYPMAVWEHGGNTLSFSNLLYILPEQDLALAVTSSGYGTDFWHSIDTAMTTLVDLPAPGTAPAYEVDPDTFDRHVGDYHDPYNIGDVVITREQDTLYVEMPLLEQLGYDVGPELEAISSEIFVLAIDGLPYDLTFIPSEPGGDSVYIRNRAFVATRVLTALPAAARPMPSAEQVARWLERAALRHAPGPQAPGPLRNESR